MRARFEIVVDVVRDPVTNVPSDPLRYHAELWQTPFKGWRMASTDGRRTRGLATRDGQRIFGPFLKTQQGKR